VQAAQFGGGFVCHRADRVKRGAERAIIDSQPCIGWNSLKPLNQRHLPRFGLRGHGFTSRARSMASA
jgi:hypothetical protein